MHLYRQFLSALSYWLLLQLFFSLHYEIGITMFGVRLGLCCAEVYYGTVGEAIASLISCYKVARETGSKLAPLNSPMVQFVPKTVP